MTERTKPYRTLANFLDKPHDATYYGYQPSYLDCLCYAAHLFTWKLVKEIPCEFLKLLDEDVRDFPLAFISTVFMLFCLVTIPLGGFFIWGSLSYFLKYRPKVLQPKMKGLHEYMDNKLNR